MFTVLTDLSLITRRELTVDPTSVVLTSGLQGTWVIFGTNGATLPSGTPTKAAWPIFNESKRDQSVGQFASDVAKTGKVTILAGKYFARTTVFTGSPTIGQALDVNSNGVLVAGTTAPVAYVTVAPRNLDYLGTTVSAMDIYVF